MSPGQPSPEMMPQRKENFRKKFQELMEFSCESDLQNLKQRVRQLYEKGPSPQSSPRVEARRLNAKKNVSFLLPPVTPDS